jgi:hypothetical protein
MLRTSRHQYLYLADNPDLRVCRACTAKDLSAAFQLLHDNYVRSGLSAANTQSMRVTAHQLLPKSDIFVAKLHGQVVATLSLIADADLGLPIESMYGPQIEQLRRSGERLAEVGSLADRRASFTRTFGVFYAMTRLMAQTARRRGTTMLVAAVHPRHARFYTQILGFEQLAGRKYCPYAEGKPAVALGLRFEDQVGTRIYEQYFGEVLPDDETDPTAIAPELRQHFAAMVGLVPLPAPVAVAGFLPEHPVAAPL